MTKKVSYVLLALVLLCLVGASAYATGRPDHRQSCTVFYAADDQVALGGNNEDWGNPFTKVWFLPPQEGSYGRVYFGFDDFFLQGGMNDQGLFFDGLAVKPVEVPPNDKPVYRGNLMDKAMAECATVECVLSLFDQYHVSGFDRYQLLVGDASGDSAILEPLAVLRKEGPFQVATNFYQSQAESETAYCWRYRKATEMLAEADGFTVDLFRDITDATHQTGAYPTLYSTIYDLKERIVYVYYFHDYENVVEIDLAQELEQGEHVYDLASLFPETEAAEHWRRPRIEQFEKRVAARLAIGVDPSLYDDYTGRYEVPADSGLPFDLADVVRQEDRLYLDALRDWMPGHELFPQSETSFFHLTYDRELDFDVTFVPDETGRVTEMLFELDGETIPMDRLEMAATPPPTTTPAVETAVAPAMPQEQEEQGNPWWLWLIIPALVLVALAVWYAVRRRR